MTDLKSARESRDEKNTPILMVSAKKEDIDKIRGLGLEQMITLPNRFHQVS